MSLKHIFDPIAIIEYQDAIAWYNERSLIAADEFIAAVQTKIKDICVSPTLYRNTYKKYREISLKKFPYSIIYLVNEEAKTLTIASIYHHKRNPKRKYRK